jgi:hypothetical protein
MPLAAVRFLLRLEDSYEFAGGVRRIFRGETYLTVGAVLMSIDSARTIDRD